MARGVVALVLVVAVAADGVTLATVPAGAMTPTDGNVVGSASARSLVGDPDDVTAGADYPGDPAEEARLVAGEQRRLIDVRSTIAAAESAGFSPSRPFRLSTTPLPTLVLAGRAAPYTLDELSEIAPRSVGRESDGSFVIREHIVIGEYATLRIEDADGLEIRLASGAEAFATVVALGGTLEIAGSTQFRVSVTSWDPQSGAPDTTTTDGRAYIRVFGGHATLSNAVFEDLGFWSGVTGGVSLTGVVLPEPWLAEDPQTAEAPPEEVVDEGPVVLAEGEALDGTGELETLSLDGTEEASSYASALVQSVTLRGNAFGLFVTNAEHVEVRDSTIESSLVDGLVMHRNVTSSSVEATIARNNAQDGFNLTRATSSVVFSRLTSTGNGRNGITIEGRPLVDGPSATGIVVTAYGDNEVRDCVSNDNGRYGIEVVGGTGITVTGNDVARNRMGIVLTADANGVVVEDNRVTDSVEQGIAARGAGLDLEIARNDVSGTEIGIYVRDSGGRIVENAISGVSNHGITLIGETGFSTIVGNVVSGSGPSPIDVVRTSGTAVRDNDLTHWRGTKPLLVVLRAWFQPLTVLWILIGIVLVASISASRSRRRSIGDPFADQAPLTTFTRGIIAREELGAYGLPESAR